jgi:NAD(P)-dependent dehydrogenase (short-subunit alcohol dehydrogenase family)
MANILVTGSSRGIGAAIISALGGHNVVGHSTGGGEGRIAADLADSDQVHALWWEAMSRLDGRIDVLVNNAGIFEADPIEADDAAWLQGWERTMQVNLTAPRSCAVSPCCISASMAKRVPGAAASSMCPAGPPIAAIRPSTGIMPRPRPA